MNPPNSSPVFYCPLRPGWLLQGQRDQHMAQKHPEHRSVEGTGLTEWHAWRKDIPLRAGKAWR